MPPQFVSDQKIADLLFGTEEPKGIFAVLVVQFLDASHDLIASATEALNALERPAVRSVRVASTSEGLVAAFRVTESRVSATGLRDLVVAAHRLAEGAGSSCWACLGCASSGKAGVQNSYRDALEGIRVASALGGEPSGIIAEDLLPASLLLAASSHRERLTAVMAPLASGGASGNKLIETLRCYFEGDFSLRSVALRLRVHRHTVAYRLARAEKLLGRSLHDARDRLIIDLALEARKVRDAVSSTSRQPGP